jgi:hypothetical protein
MTGKDSTQYRSGGAVTHNLPFSTINTGCKHIKNLKNQLYTIIKTHHYADIDQQNRSNKFILWQ